MALQAIRCGKVSTTMLYPFIAPFFCFVDSIALFNLSPKWSKHSVLNLFFVFLGQFFCGTVLQLFTVYFNPRPSKVPSPKKRKNLKFVLVQAKHAHLDKINYVLALIPAFLYIISLFLLNYNSKLFPFQISKTIAIVIQILFASFLCKFVFSVNYFKHNVYAFVLILIGSAIGIGADFNCFLGIRPRYLAWNMVLFFLAFFLFTTAEIVDKWLMDKRFLTPQILLIIEGFTGMAVYLGMIGGFSYVKCEGIFAEASFCDPGFQKKQIESFSIFKELLSEFDLFYFILIMLSSSLFHVCSKFTNYHYLPTHRTVSDLLSCLLSVLFIEMTSFLDYSCYASKAGLAIGFVVIIFGALMYNEFIILSLFGLDEYTKEMIETRKTREDSILNKDLEVIQREEDTTNSDDDYDNN